MSINHEHDIEAGFLCETCLEPLEDSRPLVEDWRVPVGRTKRLCPKCAKIEDATKECEFACAGRPGHSGECYEMYSHRDTCPGAPDCVHEDEETDKRDQPGTKLADWESMFTRMFIGEGLSPRAKMKRWNNER